MAALASSAMAEPKGAAAASAAPLGAWEPT